MSNCVPEIWKKAIITPLFKNKGQRSDPANYRPISLTSAICKVMEKIVRDSLIDFLEKSGILSIHQHGFRSKRSTTSQLIECMNDWTKILDQSQSVDIIYLDFAKAFDTVSHPKLMFKLRKLGISDELLNWIHEFLSGRTQRVKVGTSLSFVGDVKSGVPQGTVLGPVLFLIYINDLAKVVKNSCLKIYADDVKLYIRSDISVNQHLLASDLKRVYEWSLDWQLQLSIN